MARKQRGKNKDNARRSKKKVSLLDQEGVKYVDWKDVDLLRRFMSDRAKIRARRVTGNDAQQQRHVAMAIKNAREMALLPYTHRVTTQRGAGRGRGGDREARPPRPSHDTPPPPPSVTGDAEREEFDELPSDIPAGEVRADNVEAEVPAGPDQNQEG
ncbi:MAG: 30S ribosomal protein S18 [Acidimicrobiales bacterium]|nr:MAG: 30S ribosomal protein S18 [Actinomycetota bacterium]MBV6508366.1 30S ribosomal protein S18 [Acidimicrobiales bacterium]RIK04816.1 MAG: 30S ribosomal protein S18 [Acidobacteriota bacterium]